MIAHRRGLRRHRFDGGVRVEQDAEERQRIDHHEPAHVFRVTASARDGVAVAAADAVLKVVPCVRVEEPTFTADEHGDIASMTVGLSSRCGCRVRCTVRARYGDQLIEAPRPLVVNLKTVNVELPLALGGRPFIPAALHVDVMCDDGTVIRRRPGRQPIVTWTAPPARTPLRPRFTRARPGPQPTPEVPVAHP